MNKTVRLFVAALAAVAVAVGVYWYFSPIFAIKNMVAAAKASDVSTFDSYVDYPRVRENLKAQITAEVAKKAGPATDNAFAALGTMLGVSIGHTMVDALVQPGAMMEIMKAGEVQLPTDPSPAPDAANAAPQAPKSYWVLDRESANRIIVTRQVGNAPASPEDHRFVFDRSGFATWKLTELRPKISDQ